MNLSFHLHRMTSFDSFALEDWGYTIENVNWFYAHFYQVASSVEQTAQVARYFTIVIHKGCAIGLTYNAEELVNRVECIYGN
jgi:hypothetical protein